MDPSAPAVKPVTGAATDQNVPQSISANTNDQAQNAPGQPEPAAPAKPVPAPQKTQISVTGGGGIEAGAAVIVEDADDEDDEELQAPQEKKNLGVMGQGEDDEQGDEQQIVSQSAVVDVAEEAPELQSRVPEVVAGSPEVEKLVEITEPEEPKITDDLKSIGITHSGPGVIDPGQKELPAPKMPITYEQVLSVQKNLKMRR